MHVCVLRPSSRYAGHLVVIGECLVTILVLAEDLVGDINC